MSNPVTLIEQDTYDNLGSPTWSPDGRIAVSVSLGDGLDIYTMREDGSEFGPLVASSAGESSPSWSPTGDAIAYYRDRGVWIAEGDGSDQRLVTDAIDTISACPTWSRDGEWIAFSGGEDNSDIYIVRPDGSDLQQVTTGPATEAQPTFSADDARIAFAGMGVKALDLSTGEVTDLVSGSDPAYQP